MLLKKSPPKNPNRNENKKQPQNLEHHTKKFQSMGQFRNQYEGRLLNFLYYPAEHFRKKL